MSVMREDNTNLPTVKDASCNTSKKKLSYHRFREAKASIKSVAGNATKDATHEALKIWHAIEIFVRSRQPCRWLQNQ